MEVIAKKTYPQLEGIFKKGDKLTISVIPYEKDTVIVDAIYVGLDKSGKIMGIANYFKLGDGSVPNNVEKISEAVIAEKGSYKDSLVTNSLGKSYSMRLIRNFIGYNQSNMSDLFEKVN